MRIDRLRPLVVAGLVLLGSGVTASAQSRVDTNVVYGMYSGPALLLDVHHPARPNGFGIVFIPGSGWSAPLGYGAAPLKESNQVEMYVPSSPRPPGPRRRSTTCLRRRRRLSSSTATWTRPCRSTSPR